jgi:hypothetical protein
MRRAESRMIITCIGTAEISRMIFFLMFRFW